MAQGHPGASRPTWQWTELFRTFQVALDPKKLVLAAAGIVLAWLVTGFLSWAFFSMRTEPVPVDPAVYVKKGISEADAKIKSDDEYAVQKRNYDFVYGLAGPGDEHRPAGIFRVAPWSENRGPNPFWLIAGQSGDRSVTGGLFDWARTYGPHVLLEPLGRFIKPVTMLLRPEGDFGTRIYLLLVAFATLAVWAFFGGAITRIAVMQLAGKEPPTLAESLRFVCQRYVHYVAAPLVPLLFVAGIAIITILFGLIYLFPYVGDLVDGILWPIPLLLGFAQALLLVGLVGYPLMFATISAEGTDTFDALSRSYNYVYQSPWQYIWYSAVALAYGMVVIFFVIFMGSFIVYLGKWSIAQTPGTEYFTSRHADHLFMYAPTTFEWRDVLVDRPELKSTADPIVKSEYQAATLTAGNYLSAGLVGFWMVIVLLFVLGYGYCYFFTAGTMIYLLMRAHVDDTELDEVYCEEEVPDEPLLPPTTLPGPGATPPPAAPPVQMVDAPTLRAPVATDVQATPPAEKPATPS